MKIYTKTGDLGQTRLVGGQQVQKTDLRIQAYGNIDELNSLLGIIVLHIQENSKNEIIKIQNFLFNLGSHLATPDLEWKKSLPKISDEKITELEIQIDLMEQALPKLKNFILPGGTNGACYLHLARTVCRRTERSAVHLLNELQNINLINNNNDANNNNVDNNSAVSNAHSHILKNDFVNLDSEAFAVRYLNRLSDYLFVLARYENFLNNQPDQIWNQST